jgi:DNA repair protein RadA
MATTKVKMIESAEMNKNNLDTMNLEEIPGLGPKSAKMLQDGGITKPSKLMESSLQDLEILGLTRTTSKKLRQAVRELFPDIYKDFIEDQSLEDVEGIGPTTAKSLREKGMNIHLLQTTPVKELESRYGLTADTANKYQSLISVMKGGFFKTAFDIMENERNTDYFTFGADSLDKLFSVPELGISGIKAGDTYEFFGAFRSGKSQLCHQLCVTIQLPKEMGGLGKKAIYIDSEGTFSPSRIIQMARRLKEENEWDKSVDDILGDILVARANNTDMQKQIVIKLLDILGSTDKDVYGLLIVDSVSSHFRAEYAGRGTLAERQQTLNHHLSILHRIADTYGLAIIVTNQVQSNPAQFFGDPTVAVGGNIMGHWATTRCYLRKSKGEKRVIRIFDSPMIGELEAIFEITENGVLNSES